MQNSPPFPVVWITGASTGIGRALALRLAREGCTVAASARRADALDELAKAADALPGRIVPVPLDVTDTEAVKRVGAQVMSELGVPDLCVLNAGNFIPINAKRLNAADVEAQFDLNVMGVVRVLEQVVPGMVKRKSGRIAVVSSVSGYRGLRSAMGYGATKAALINMCETTRMELSDHDIVVQLVNPGFIKTPLTDKNDFPMPFLMPVEKAVEQFYRGLLSNRFEITFPKRFTWILKALRLLPYGIYLPLMNRITRAG